MTHAVRDAGPFLYLDMVGVMPKWRGASIGERLLHSCWTAAVDRGIPSIEWTYDPLEGANANLYIRKLGAIGVRFYPNYYGDLSGDRHAVGPTDRLWVTMASAPTLRVVAHPEYVLTAGESVVAGMPDCVGLVIPRDDVASTATQAGAVRAITGKALDEPSRIHGDFSIWNPRS